MHVKFSVFTCCYLQFSHYPEQLLSFEILFFTTFLIWELWVQNWNLSQPCAINSVSIRKISSASEQHLCLKQEGKGSLVFCVASGITGYCLVLAGQRQLSYPKLVLWFSRFQCNVEAKKEKIKILCILQARYVLSNPALLLGSLGNYPLFNKRGQAHKPNTSNL